MFGFNFRTKNVGAGAQVDKSAESNGTPNTKRVTTVTQAYDIDPTVKRCVNEVVDSSAAIKFDVKMPENALIRGLANAGRIDLSFIDMLLNDKPNPQQSRFEVFAHIYMDLLMTGQAFLFHDKQGGNYLYPLKAGLVEVIAGDTTLVERYTYNGRVNYDPADIIRITDSGFNHLTQAINGNPRINAILDSVNSKAEALSFQDGIYRNDSILQFALETDAILGKRLKKRFEEEIRVDTNRRTGRKTAIILDGGMKLKPVQASLTDTNVVEILAKEDQAICTGIGVPYSIIAQTTNSSPTADRLMFYHSTINTFCRRVASALEFHFGVDIDLDFSAIPMVDMQIIHEQANSVSTLVNNGVATTNEGRGRLRMDPLTSDQMDIGDPDTVRVPQNVAGSATDPSLGGRGNES